MQTFNMTARTLHNGGVEVSNGPLVVEFDIYGDVSYSNVKKDTPQYAAALHVFKLHVYEKHGVPA